MGVVPMAKRRDPVVGMAEAVRRMQRKCDAVASETQDYVMCGASFVNVFPNNAVNIPQQVRSPVWTDVIFFFYKNRSKIPARARVCPYSQMFML